jgi:2-isopropylmalate synthase
VTLGVEGDERYGSCRGNGPVEALYGAVDAAIEPVLGWHAVLTSYEIKAVSGGEDAQGQVVLRCRRSIDEAATAETVTGHGLSTNIVEASLSAYLVATNKLRAAEAGELVGVISPARGKELP